MRPKLTHVSRRRLWLKLPKTQTPPVNVTVAYTSKSARHYLSKAALQLNFQPTKYGDNGYFANFGLIDRARLEAQAYVL